MEIKTIFVLAGSFAEFKQYVREQKHSIAGYRYADSPEKMMEAICR